MLQKTPNGEYHIALPGVPRLKKETRNLTQLHYNLPDAFLQFLIYILTFTESGSFGQPKNEITFPLIFLCLSISQRVLSHYLTSLTTKNGLFPFSFFTAKDQIYYTDNQIYTFLLREQFITSLFSTQSEYRVQLKVTELYTWPGLSTCPSTL